MNIGIGSKELGVTNVGIGTFCLGGAILMILGYLDCRTRFNSRFVWPLRMSSLNSIIDMDELKELVTSICQKKPYLEGEMKMKFLLDMR